MEKIGLIVNPKAGKGPDAELIWNVVKKLSPKKIYAGTGELGENYLHGTDLTVEKISINVRGSSEDTIELVKKMDELELDAIVIFGGDGTMSDASIADTPLLCIPAGTTNVSPLMCRLDFNPAELKEKYIDGLQLKIDGEIFYAFNDIVLGSTILSTVGGRRVQIDAEAFLRGDKILVKKPRKFYAKLKVKSKVHSGSEMEPEKRVIEGIFGNVFVSPTDSRYLGKGIAGGASLSTFIGFDAVVACINEPVVFEYTKEEMRRIEPIVTQTLSFDEGENVKIYSNEVISRDGNPVKKMNGVAEIEFKRKLVRVLKP